MDNAAIQKHVIQLRISQGNNISLAKLTKEIMKLADTYKVLELHFGKQASKHRFNFQNWIMKLKANIGNVPSNISSLTW
jgi:hypothetical protein